MQPVADQLLDHLLSAFPADRNYRRDAITRPPMPPILAHYLRHLLERHLEREAASFGQARSAWFDYEHPEVQGTLRALGEALGRHARIPAEAWRGALGEAVARVTAYLVRPVEILADALFEDDDVLPVKVVLHRLGSFDAYLYLHTALHQYLEQRDVQHVERERIQSVLARVDRRMTADHAPDDWVHLLQPLFELLAPLHGGEVPTALLAAFFGAKERADVAEQLDEVRRSGYDTLGPDALHALLSDVAASRPVETLPAPRPETPIVPASEAPVPLWMQFQQGDADHTPRRAEPPRLAPPSPRPAPPRGGATPIWMRYQRGGAPQTANPDLGALERYVLGDRAAERRQLFVARLFDGSLPAYRAVLERLHDTAEWSAASRIIAEEVFKKYRVNIYDDVAVAFTEAVEQRYR